MAQADLNVANQSGSAFRADLNNQLLALGTLMSGASEPSTTYAYMLWADTANAVLKQRNAANGAWITLRNLDGTYARGTAGSPSISFDGGTGIYSLGDDQVAISTAGTGRLFIDASGRILAGVSTALTNAYSISTALAPVVQIEGNTGNAAALSITRHASAAANLLLQRGVTGTPVADTEALGQVNFNGFDGTNYINAALIRAVVEGTPGTGSMPGRLSFQTTASGASTSTERLRIDSAGQIMAAALGTASLPVWSFTGDPNTGVYSAGADQLSIATGGSERFRFGASGQIGIGGATYGTAGQVLTSGGASAAPTWTTPSATSDKISEGNTEAEVVDTGSDGHFKVTTEGSERCRVDSSGRFLVGTSSSSASAAAVFRGFAGAPTGQGIIHLQVGRNNASTGPNENLGSVRFANNEDNIGALISGEADLQWNSGDYPSRLVFSVTADGASSPTERMRIDNKGYIHASNSGTYNDSGLSFAAHTYQNDTSNSGVQALIAWNNSYASVINSISCLRSANSAYSFITAVSGNGSTSFADNEFNLRGDGTGLCDGSWTGGGADYAEYFEWSDSNPDAEDRRGISVVLDGDKIREAAEGEDPIGVISGNPSVVGDAAWNKWSGKYLRDEFGTYIQEDYEVEDEDGNTVIQQRRKLNPAYDPDVEYISREQRPEWDCVGLMGKLRIRKGQITGSRWIKMRDISDSVEEWLVR